MGLPSYILLSATKLLTPSDGMPVDIISPDYKEKPAIGLRLEEAPKPYSEFRLEKIRLDGNSGLSNPTRDSVDYDSAYSGTTSMNSPADDRIDDKKIIENFNKIYGKVKGKSGIFEEPIDINGDGTLDKVTFELKDDGGVTIGTEQELGRRLDLDFEVGGSWLGKIYAIFKENKVMYYKDGKPLCKSQWVKEEKLKGYIDAVAKYYEK